MRVGGCEGGEDVKDDEGCRVVRVVGSEVVRG